MSEKKSPVPKISCPLVSTNRKEEIFAIKSLSLSFWKIEKNLDAKIPNIHAS